MKTLMESILQGYGSLVTVREGESARTFRALVQPVTEKGWQATRKVIETLGKAPEGTVCVHWACGRGASRGAEARGAGRGISCAAVRNEVPGG